MNDNANNNLSPEYIWQPKSWFTIETPFKLDFHLSQQVALIARSLIDLQRHIAKEYSEAQGVLTIALIRLCKKYAHDTQAMSADYEAGCARLLAIRDSDLYTPDFYEAERRLLVAGFANGLPNGVVRTLFELLTEATVLCTSGSELYALLSDQKHMVILSGSGCLEKTFISEQWFIAEDQKVNGAFAWSTAPYNLMVVLSECVDKGENLGKKTLSFIEKTENSFTQKIFDLTLEAAQSDTKQFQLTCAKVGDLGRLTGLMSEMALKQEFVSDLVVRLHANEGATDPFNAFFFKLLLNSDVSMLWAWGERWFYIENQEKILNRAQVIQYDLRQKLLYRPVPYSELVAELKIEEIKSAFEYQGQSLFYCSNLSIRSTQENDKILCDDLADLCRDRLLLPTSLLPAQAIAPAESQIFPPRPAMTINFYRRYFSLLGLHEEADYNPPLMRESAIRLLKEKYPLNYELPPVIEDYAPSAFIELDFAINRQHQKAKTGLDRFLRNCWDHCQNLPEFDGQDHLKIASWIDAYILYACIMIDYFISMRQMANVVLKAGLHGIIAIDQVEVEYTWMINDLVLNVEALIPQTLIPFFTIQCDTIEIMQKHDDVYFFLSRGEYFLKYNFRKKAFEQNTKIAFAKEWPEITFSEQDRLVAAFSNPDHYDAFIFERDGNDGEKRKFFSKSSYEGGLGEDQESIEKEVCIDTWQKFVGALSEKDYSILSASYNHHGCIEFLLKNIKDNHLYAALFDSKAQISYKELALDQLIPDEPSIEENKSYTSQSLSICYIESKRRIISLDRTLITAKHEREEYIEDLLSLFKTDLANFSDFLSTWIYNYGENSDNKQDLIHYTLPKNKKLLYPHVKNGKLYCLSSFQADDLPIQSVNIESDLKNFTMIRAGNFYYLIKIKSEKFYVEELHADSKEYSIDIESTSEQAINFSDITRISNAIYKSTLYIIFYDFNCFLLGRLSIPNKKLSLVVDQKIGFIVSTYITQAGLYCLCKDQEQSLLRLYCIEFDKQGQFKPKHIELRSKKPLEGLNTIVYNLPQNASLIFSHGNHTDQDADLVHIYYHVHKQDGSDSLDYQSSIDIKELIHGTEKVIFSDSYVFANKNQICLALKIRFFDCDYYAFLHVMEYGMHAKLINIMPADDVGVFYKYQRQEKLETYFLDSSSIDHAKIKDLQDSFLKMRIPFLFSSKQHAATSVPYITHVLDLERTIRIIKDRRLYKITHDIDMKQDLIKHEFKHDNKIIFNKTESGWQIIYSDHNAGGTICQKSIKQPSWQNDILMNISKAVGSRDGIIQAPHYLHEMKRIAASFVSNIKTEYIDDVKKQHDLVSKLPVNFNWKRFDLIALGKNEEVTYIVFYSSIEKKLSLLLIDHVFNINVITKKRFFHKYVFTKIYVIRDLLLMHDDSQSVIFSFKIKIENSLEPKLDLQLLWENRFPKNESEDDLHAPIRLGWSKEDNLPFLHFIKNEDKLVCTPYLLSLQDENQGIFFENQENEFQGLFSNFNKIWSFHYDDKQVLFAYKQGLPGKNGEFKLFQLKRGQLNLQEHNVSHDSDIEEQRSLFKGVLFQEITDEKCSIQLIHISSLKETHSGRISFVLYWTVTGNPYAWAENASNSEGSFTFIELYGYGVNRMNQPKFDLLHHFKVLEPIEFSKCFLFEIESHQYLLLQGTSVNKRIVVNMPSWRQFDRSQQRKLVALSDEHAELVMQIPLIGRDHENSALRIPIENSSVLIQQIKDLPAILIFPWKYDCIRLSSDYSNLNTVTQSNANDPACIESINWRDAQQSNGNSESNYDEHLEQKACKRLIKISTVLISAQRALRLYKLGFDSAYSIARIPEFLFVKKTDSIFCDIATATQVHRIASYLNAKNSIAYLDYMQTSSPFVQSRGLKRYITNDTNYAKIFGGQNYFSYDKTNTIFSPGAYFFDLMRIISDDKYFIFSNNKFLLSVRRPDLFELPLDKEHTFSKIRYLSLVNGLMSRILLGQNTYTLSYKNYQNQLSYYCLEVFSQLTSLESELNYNALFKPINLPLEKIEKNLALFSETLYNLCSQYYQVKLEELAIPNPEIVYYVTYFFLRIRHAEIQWIKSPELASGVLRGLLFDKSSMTVSLHDFCNKINIPKEHVKTLVNFADQLPSFLNANSSEKLRIDIDYVKKTETLRYLSIEHIRNFIFIYFMYCKLHSFFTNEISINQVDHLIFLLHKSNNISYDILNAEGALDNSLNLLAKTVNFCSRFNISIQDVTHLFDDQISEELFADNVTLKYMSEDLLSHLAEDMILDLYAHNNSSEQLKIITDLVSLFDLTQLEILLFLDQGQRTFHEKQTFMDYGKQISISTLLSYFYRLKQLSRMLSLPLNNIITYYMYTMNTQSSIYTLFSFGSEHCLFDFASKLYWIQTSLLDYKNELPVLGFHGENNTYFIDKADFIKEALVEIASCNGQYTAYGTSPDLSIFTALSKQYSVSEACIAHVIRWLITVPQQAALISVLPAVLPNEEQLEVELPALLSQLHNLSNEKIKNNFCSCLSTVLEQIKLLKLDCYTPSSKLETLALLFFLITPKKTGISPLKFFMTIEVQLIEFSALKMLISVKNLSKKLGMSLEDLCHYLLRKSIDEFPKASLKRDEHEENNKRWSRYTEKLRSISGTMDLAKKIDVLHCYQYFYELECKLKLSADNIYELRKAVIKKSDLSPDHLNRLSDMLEQIRVEKQQREKYHTAILEMQRDELLSRTLFFLNKNGIPEIKTHTDLYAYLLIDPLTAGDYETSFVAQGISSLQIFFQRCRMGAEKSVQQQIPESWWDWMLKYRAWEANRKILLYPENYIRPELRNEQSDEYRELTQMLVQSGLDDSMIKHALVNYVTQLTKFSQLIYCDAILHHEEDEVGKKRLLYLLARTHEQPLEYYYRSATSYESNPNKWSWGYWNKINCQIRVGLASIILFCQRIFIFWVEPKLKNEMKDPIVGKEIERQNKLDYKIYYTYNIAGMTWSQPQLMNSDVIKDDILKFQPIIDKLQYNDNLLCIDDECNISFLSFNRVDVRVKKASELTVLYFNHRFTLDDTLRLVSAEKETADDKIEKHNSKFEIDSSSINQSMPNQHRSIIINESTTIKRNLSGHDWVLYEDDRTTRLSSSKAIVSLSKKLLALNADISQMYMMIHAELEAPTEKKSSTISSLQLDFNGAMALYYWELFFFIPYYISQRLREEKQFKQALKWQHFIFDPLQTYSTILPKNSDLIQSRQDFYSHNRTSESGFRFPLFREINTNSGFLSLNNKELLEIYYYHAFNPHAFAKLRPVIYMKVMVTSYIKTLIEWADTLLAEGQRESIEEARLYYMIAQDLLGEKPEALGQKPEVIGMSINDYLYAELKYNKIVVGILGHVEDQAKPFPVPEVLSQSNLERSLQVFNPYFSIPENEQFIQHWDLVADRLFKIRHSLDLHGVKRELDLFSPEINPMDLVRAAASDGGRMLLQHSLPSMQPNYRFSYMIGHALEFVRRVESIGNQLQHILEKYDAERLATLMNQQAIEWSHSLEKIMEMQISVVESQVDELEERITSSKSAEEHYANLIKENVSGQEKEARALRIAASIPALISSAARTTAGILSLSPNVGSPFAMTYGGTQLAGSALAYAGAADMNNHMISTKASDLETQARFDRRLEEWKFQQTNIKDAIKQLEKQREITQIHKSIAEKQLFNHQKAMAHQTEIFEFYNNKFTNIELYRWMIMQMSALHSQFCNIACVTAKDTQNAYERELGKPYEKLRSFSLFAQKKGLLAGSELLLQLTQLQQSYLNENQHIFEMQENFSLLDIKTLECDHDKESLDKNCLFQKLKSDGIEFSLGGFENRYVGYDKFKIKALSVTIEGLARPHENINLILTQVATKLASPSQKQIIISHGIGDYGIFHLDFNSPKYLPFEGTSAESKWTIKFADPKSDYVIENIADIMIHLKFTAEYAQISCPMPRL